MSSTVNRLAVRLAGYGIRRRTVRVRLAGVYGSLFLVSGAALLAITYLLVAGWPDLRAATLLPPRHPHTRQRWAPSGLPRWSGPLSCTTC